MNKRITQLTGGLSVLILGVALLSPVAAPAAAASPVPVPSASDREDAANRPNRGAPRVHPEYAAATSKFAKDKKGYRPSLYKGKYYYKDQEGFRKCVMNRESHFTYTAANGSSSARGAYQFLDSSWRGGLVHMMLKETKKEKDGLGKKIRQLRNYPIHKWSRYFQDRAWFTALNYNGKWSGKHHWNATVSGTGC